jgi:hypothetical protein
VNEHRNKDQHKSFFVAVFFSALLSVAFLACMEEPSPVGSRLLPDADLLKLDTTFVGAIKASSEQNIPTKLLPSRLLVGKTRDREAWAALRFNAIPDSLVLVNVLGAELQLRVNYHFGDSLAPFAFDVHNILRSWGSDSLTIDSLRMPGFFNPSPMSSWSAVPLGDTATVTVSLDTAIVRAWLNAPLDTVKTNFGVLLKPRSQGVIKGFATSIASIVEHRPRLVVRYSRQGTTRVDTAQISGSTDVFAAFTEDTAWLSDSSRVYIHNGISSRGVIEFDISSFTKNATIHKAVLEVTLDPQASRLNSYSADSLYAFFVTKDGVLPNLFSLSQTAVSEGRKVYRFPITSFVQIWARSTEPRKVVLAGYTEHYSLDSFVLFGASSPFKPRLIITYSLLR